ncbi:MAG: GNAT family N-acetyltransferase [Catenulispora sp.]|nr:GNAT family N-acetyltransferase [Catenulispora sp.]
MHVIPLGVRMVDPAPLRDVRNVFCRALMDMGVDIRDAEAEAKAAVRKSQTPVVVNGAKYVGIGADGKRFRSVAVDVDAVRVVAVVPATQRAIRSVIRRCIWCARHHCLARVLAMEIREPLAADVPDLGRLHAEAWQQAYDGKMPAELLVDVTVERRTAMWERILDPARVRPDRERIVVADVGGRAAGFAWTGPCRDADGPDGAGELYAINVAPEAWGTGAGQALLEAAHESLTAMQFATAVLWVLPSNARARRFYERNGWAADGVEPTRGSAGPSSPTLTCGVLDNPATSPLTSLPPRSNVQSFLQCQFDRRRVGKHKTPGQRPGVLCLTRCARRDSNP